MTAWFSSVQTGPWPAGQLKNAKNCAGLVTEGCIVVSDCMLISILSMSAEPLEMSSTEAADALAPQVGDLKAEDLPSSWCLMCIFK